MMCSMRTKSISETLYRRLDQTVGQHSRIAAEAGISQASISRYYLRLACPTLTNAEKLLDWFAADDARKREARKLRLVERSAVRLSNTERVGRSRRSSATTPIGQ